MRTGSHLKMIVRRGQAEFVKKNVRHFTIVMLAGVDQDLFRYYKDVIELRREHSCLRRGGFHMLIADAGAATFSFSRSLGKESLIVLLNRSDKLQRIDLTRDVPPPSAGGRISPIFASTGSASDVAVSATPAGVRVDVPALTGVVLEATGAEK